MLFSMLIIHSQGAAVPPNIWTFNDDYYTVYGGPEMVVSVLDAAEYERGESSSVLIRIMNQGKITGFKAENEPSDPNEVALSKIELQQEYGVTNAVGLMVNLRAEGAPVDIKTYSQGAGSLVSGQVSQPVGFDISVWDSAQAGSYTLYVDLTYQYPKDVQVSGDVDTNHIDYKILYQEVNESHEIIIVIKKQADFETAGVSGELQPGASGTVTITFRNTGEASASRATARLRLSDPLSSTDYTAFLGDMEPGMEIAARFNIDVDSDATAKAYPVRAEVEYEDIEGETRVSDTIYVPVNVTAPEAKGGMFQYLPQFAAGMVVAGISVYIYMKRRAGGAIDGK